MSDHTLDLTAKPKGATLDAWQALARKSLGDAFEGVLGARADWPSADASGVPGAAPFMRGTQPARTRWDIRTFISETDPACANVQALDDIAGGSTSLWIDVGAFGGHADGLSRALDGVPAEIVIALNGAKLADARAALLHAPGTKLFIGLDDFAAMARGAGLIDYVTQTAKLTREIVSSYPSANAISIDTRPYHNGGATSAIEIATALASGVGYLRALSEAGIGIDAAARQIAFILVTDADFVASIAKLRAFRRVWARVLDACGAGNAMRDVHVTACSSALMMTRHDAHTNILRTTLAGFAGAVGGADAIALLPFDARRGAASDEARRIARNTQSILLEEANIARVIDPAGGAFAIERVSENLAQAAWRQFQEIESQGGMAAVLSNGFIARTISESWDARRKHIAAREEWITGVSDFPLLSEPSPQTATAELRFAPANPKAEPLPKHHLDEGFEALRAASNSHLATHGERPKIYLVCIGTEIDAAARAAFAKSLFESGGIEAVAGVPSNDAQNAAAAFLDSGISLAALCSSDAIYSETALAFAHEIRRSGARYLYFIGEPGELQEPLREAGANEFVPDSVDAIELLKRAHEMLGLAP